MEDRWSHPTHCSSSFELSLQLGVMQQVRWGLDVQESVSNVSTEIYSDSQGEAKLDSCEIVQCQSCEIGDCCHVEVDEKDTQYYHYSHLYVHSDEKYDDDDCQGG